MLETLAAAMALQNWTYTVKIVQQPVRARMCGLGDRDRRPISPPLIVQLHAYDPATGRETPIKDIDTTFLILAADLRSSDAQHDANLVPSSTTSSRAPTISTCSSTAASPPSRSHTPPSPEFGYPSPASSQMSPMSTYAPSIAETAVCSGIAAPAFPPLPPPSSTTSAVPSAQPPSTTSKKRSRSIDDEPQSVVLPLTPAEPPAKRLVRGPSEDSRASCPAKAAAAAAAFIPYVRTRHAAAPKVLPPPLQEVPVERAAADVDELHEDEAREAVPNLIGTLHTNAHKLKGVEGDMGIYFVLPDLSVRTEGAFRIRVRLLSIGVRRVRCESLSPVVADAHSDEFRVFSAKKFEGMLDPTPLSQCFAKQGVRIPTRRVTKARAGKASAATAPQAVAVKEEEA